MSAYGTEGPFDEDEANSRCIELKGKGYWATTFSKGKAFYVDYSEPAGSDNPMESAAKEELGRAGDTVTGTGNFVKLDYERGTTYVDPRKQDNQVVKWNNKDSTTTILDTEAEESTRSWFRRS